MKHFTKFYLCLIFALAVLSASAQSTTENYVKVYKALGPHVDSLSGVHNKDSVAESIVFYDGLGREVQSVLREASPRGEHGSPGANNIVTISTYDGYGKKRINYLPFSSYRQDGERIPNRPGDVEVFYRGIAHVDSAAALSETILEHSELSRVLEQSAPGVPWQIGGGHTIQKQYRSNITSDSILRFSYDDVTGISITADTNTYYPDHSLSVTKTIDEEGNDVLEFVDKEGRMICKKVKAAAGVYAYTYYVYDQRSNLTTVVPPEGVRDIVKLIISPSFNITQIAPVLSNWCFLYKYDGRNRMTAKKLPGADSVYMVYDDRDRLVLTQDGGMRPNKQWQFTKYDELNRPVLTGMYTAAATYTQQVMTQNVANFYANTVGAKYWENRGGTIHGYTNQSYPSVTDAWQYWTITYYDNYKWIKGIYDSTRLHFAADQFQPGELPSELEEAPKNWRVIGKVTGTKTKILDGGPNYLYAATYYDKKGRVIQTVADNYKLGTDRVTNILDFTGKVLYSKSVHVESDVAWTERLFFSEFGRLLSSTSGGPGWNTSGAVSTQLLPADADGWVEGTATGTDSWRIGLTASNQVEMDYALMATAGSMFTRRGTTSAGSFGILAKGDVIRIHRVGPTIYFYRNGSQFSSMTSVNTSALMIDFTAYSVGATLSNVKSSFTTSTHSVLRRFTYDHMGRLLETWHKLDSLPEVLLAENKYNQIGQLEEKNLHSSDDGETTLQGIDYRYNVRGWLTSINTSDLSNGSILNNDYPGQFQDLFGMNLLYNEVESGVNDDAGLFNGNISAVTWGRWWGNTPDPSQYVAQSAYKYTYDPMNRITSAAFRVKPTYLPPSDWTTSNKYSESNYQYDLNGNIKSLTRNGSAGTAIDVLTYDYGSGTSRSNKLLKVADSGNKAEGFIDGSNSGSDYTYDANGNMTVDKNKSINNPIPYWYPFNLPATIRRSELNGPGSTVSYLYDAQGRKLCQVVNYYNRNITTDYVGEYLYEDDILQSIQHDEGRVSVATSERVYYNDGTTIAGTTTSLATVSVDSPTLHNGQTVLKIVTNASVTLPGVFVATDIPVFAGERYVVRVKGSNSGSNIVPSPNVRVRVVKPDSSTIDIEWPTTMFPNKPDAKSWVEQVVILPSNIPMNSTLSAGLFHTSTNSTPVTYFIDEFEILRQGTSTPIYQYNIKDHLGNSRVTFTTKYIDAVRATLETDSADIDRSNFLRYDLARRVKSSLFDHTNDNETDTVGYAQRLNGSANEKIGLARSLAVMPGDGVNVEVYAKYVDPNPDNWQTALTTLMGYIASPGTAPTGTIIDGSGYSISGSSPLGFDPYVSAPGDPDTGAPKAFLNMIFINKNFDPGSVQPFVQQISPAAMEDGSDVPHEHLTLATTFTEEGYVFIYLSNDNPTEADVYFDDFRVEHVKNPIIQSQDYYPFGLTFNGYQREDVLVNRRKFQGQEHVDALDLGWDSFKWRNSMPEIGRFFNVDPLATKYYYNSPYAFSENKVIAHVELEGLEAKAYMDREIARLERTWNNAVDQLKTKVDQGTKFLNRVSLYGKAEFKVSYGDRLAFTTHKGVGVDANFGSKTWFRGSVEANTKEGFKKPEVFVKNDKTEEKTAGASFGAPVVNAPGLGPMSANASLNITSVSENGKQVSEAVENGTSFSNAAGFGVHVTTGSETTRDGTENYTKVSPFTTGYSFGFKTTIDFTIDFGIKINDQ